MRLVQIEAHMEKVGALKNTYRVSELNSFLIVFFTATLVDVGMRWSNSPFDFLILFLGTLLAFTPFTRELFIVFIISSTIRLLSLFPNIDSYLILNLLFNLAFLSALAMKWREKASWEITYARLKPFIRYVTILVYFFAGFHKFNQDFLNPATSCASSIASTIMWSVFGSSVTLPSAVLKIFPYLVLFVELGGAFFLLHHLTRKFGIIALVLMHLSLSLISFADFTACMFWCLFCFIGDSYWNSLEETIPAVINGTLMGRLLKKLRLPFSIYTYLWINLISTFTMATLFIFAHSFKGRLQLHINFFLLSLALLFGLFLVKKNKLNFDVSLQPNVIWKPLWAFVAILFVNSLSPYLGLRSGGNLAMFSNLVTENHVSNHFIMPAEAFKITNYLDDIVWIRKIDPRIAYHYHHIGPPESLVGMGLPVIEFNKLATFCRKNKMQNISATVSYQGKDYSISDLATDSQVSFSGSRIIASLFTYHPIQEKPSPNLCRW